MIDLIYAKLVPLIIVHFDCNYKSLRKRLKLNWCINYTHSFNDQYTITIYVVSMYQ